MHFDWHAASRLIDRYPDLTFEINFSRCYHALFDARFAIFNFSSITAIPVFMRELHVSKVLHKNKYCNNTGINKEYTLTEKVYESIAICWGYLIGT